MMPVGLMSHASSIAARFAILLGLIGSIPPAAPAQDKPDSPPLKLGFRDSMTAPAVVAGSEFARTIGIESRPGATVPERYRFTFTQRRAGGLVVQAGTFMAETSRVEGNNYECTAKLKAPRRPGEYTLTVEPVAIRSLRKTPEEKIGTTTTIKVAE